MKDDERETLKIQEDSKLQLEVAKLKYQYRTTLAVTVIGPILLALIQFWIAHETAITQKQAAASVEATAIAAAADVKKVAAEKAEEVKSELFAATEQHDEKLSELVGKADAIVGGVDANTKLWKAYKTKDPTDMNVAETAVANAERLSKTLPGGP